MHLFVSFVSFVSFVICVLKASLFGLKNWKSRKRAYVPAWPMVNQWSLELLLGKKWNIRPSLEVPHTPPLQ